MAFKFGFLVILGLVVTPCAADDIGSDATCKNRGECEDGTPKQAVPEDVTALFQGKAAQFVTARVSSMDDANMAQSEAEMEVESESDVYADEVEDGPSTEMVEMAAKMAEKAAGMTQMASKDGATMANKAAWMTEMAAKMADEVEDGPSTEMAEMATKMAETAAGMTKMASTDGATMAKKAAGMTKMAAKMAKKAAKMAKMAAGME